VKVFSYAKTMAGAQRLASERRQPIAAIEAVREEIALVAVPVANNVVRLMTVGRVIDLMARMHGCTQDEVKGPLKSKRIVAARDAAICALMVFRPNLSRGQIGLLFNRDPSTVLHAQRKRGLS
jgi:chromosomal replication initiation ATPase DnaA